MWIGKTLPQGSEQLVDLLSIPFERLPRGKQQDRMDFNGNAKIIIKYGAFTLAYGQLLGRLADFKRALSPATGCTSE